MNYVTRTKDRLKSILAHSLSLTSSKMDEEVFGACDQVSIDGEFELVVSFHPDTVTNPNISGITTFLDINKSTSIANHIDLSNKIYSTKISFTITLSPILLENGLARVDFQTFKQQTFLYYRKVFEFAPGFENRLPNNGKYLYIPLIWSIPSRNDRNMAQNNNNNNGHDINNPNNFVPVFITFIDNKTIIERKLCLFAYEISLAFSIRYSLLRIRKYTSISSDEIGTIPCDTSDFECIIPGYPCYGVICENIGNILALCKIKKPPPTTTEKTKNDATKFDIILNDAYKYTLNIMNKNIKNSNDYYTKDCYSYQELIDKSCWIKIDACFMQRLPLHDTPLNESNSNSSINSNSNSNSNSKNDNNSKKRNDSGNVQVSRFRSQLNSTLKHHMTSLSKGLNVINRCEDDMLPQQQQQEDDVDVDVEQSQDQQEKHQEQQQQQQQQEQKSGFSISNVKWTVASIGQAVVNSVNKKNIKQSKANNSIDNKLSKIEDEIMEEYLKYKKSDIYLSNFDSEGYVVARYLGHSTVKCVGRLESINESEMNENEWYPYPDPIMMKHYNVWIGKHLNVKLFNQFKENLIEKGKNECGAIMSPLFKSTNSDNKDNDNNNNNDKNEEKEKEKEKRYFEDSQLARELIGNILSFFDFDEIRSVLCLLNKFFYNASLLSSSYGNHHLTLMNNCLKHFIEREATYTSPNNNSSNSGSNSSSNSNIISARLSLPVLLKNVYSIAIVSNDIEEFSGSIKKNELDTEEKEEKKNSSVLVGGSNVCKLFYCFIFPLECQCAFFNTIDLNCSLKVLCISHCNQWNYNKDSKKYIKFELPSNLEEFYLIDTLIYIDNYSNCKNLKHLAIADFRRDELKTTQEFFQIIIDTLPKNQLESLYIHNDTHQNLHVLTLLYQNHCLSLKLIAFGGRITFDNIFRRVLLQGIILVRIFFFLCAIFVFFWGGAYLLLLLLFCY